MNGYFNVVKELKDVRTKKFLISELTYSYFENGEKHSVTKYEVQFDNLQDIEKEIHCGIGKICLIEMKV